MTGSPPERPKNEHRFDRFICTLCGNDKPLKRSRFIYAKYAANIRFRVCSGCFARYSHPAAR